MNANQKALEAIQSVLPAIAEAAQALNNSIVVISNAVKLIAQANETQAQTPNLKLAPVEAVKQNSLNKYDTFPSTLTIMQAAKMMDITYPNMYKLAISKVTPFRQVGKKKRVVFKEDLLAFFEERKGKSLLVEYDEEYSEAS